MAASIDVMEIPAVPSLEPSGFMFYVLLFM